MHTVDGSHWHWLSRLGDWARTFAQRDAAAGWQPPPLAHGERVLAVGYADDDQPEAIGSTHALHYRDHNRTDGWIRVGWEELDHACWHPGQSTLTLTGLPGSGRSPFTLQLSRPGTLPQVIQDRIAAAMIATDVVAIDHGQARITARLRPGTSYLVWTVRVCGGLDPADTAVQQQIDAAIHAIRNDLGV